MGELTAGDVEIFTDGRLENDNGFGETTRMLNAVLTMARRYVGWHVSPVKVGDTVMLDGPGSRILDLPTRKLTALTSVKEDGVITNVSTLRWSAGGPPGILERPVSVRKRSGAIWPCHYAAVEVVMTHGYTEEEAADWRQAILQTVSQVALISGGGSSGVGLLSSKKVDDVTYQWSNPLAGAAQEVLYSVDSILTDYCLPRVEFL